MARKTVVPQRVISLDDIHHDEIDRATALAVLTANPIGKTKKDETIFSLEHLLEAVRSLVGRLLVSLSEINRRIRRWVGYGWVKEVDKNSICPTKEGLRYINLLAEAA